MSYSSTSIQNEMEESMMKIHSESFDDWVQNFAINLENIWEEPSAKALETDKNHKQKNNSAVVIGRGPSIKKHGHLELLAKSNYNGSIICTDGSLISALKAGITPEKFPKFYTVTIDPYQIVKKYYDDPIITKFGSKINGVFSTIVNPKVVGLARNAGVKIHWLDAGTLEDDSALSKLNRYNGILVPGGFGERGIEGKIKAIEYARVNRVPFFGICLGMHCAVIEFARSVVLLRKANSAEFAPNTPDPVIDLLLDQDAKGNKGGTMRLGEYRCQLRKNSNAFKAYGVREVYERHRHRYEFNNRYRIQLEEAGLKFSGLSPNGNLVEIIELENHPWFLAGQFHPEFKSSPMEPHPLFTAFISHSRLCKNGENTE